jgi:hypothetical protein
MSDHVLDCFGVPSDDRMDVIIPDRQHVQHDLGFRASLLNPRRNALLLPTIEPTGSNASRPLAARRLDAS